jgi:hypothetical protein
VAGIAFVFVGTSFSSAASLGQPAHKAAVSWPHGYTSIMLPAIGSLKLRRAFLPQQAAATATPTGTVAPTPAPTTNPAYPDPVTLLNNSVNLFDQVTSARFENIIDGDQQSTVKLHIDAVGDANCTGPSLKAKVTGKVTLEGTSQSNSVNFNLIQVKNSYYKKGKSTKKVWKKVAPQAATAFSYPVDPPLNCPNAANAGGTGSNGGSGTATPVPSTQIKDVTNLGPDTVGGVAVWHIQLTQVAIDSTGAASQSVLDFYVGQKHPLPYKYLQTVNDTTNGVKIVFQQLFTKFGEKVTIKAPTVGSSKP